MARPNNLPWNDITDLLAKRDEARNREERNAIQVARCSFVRSGVFLYCLFHKTLLEDGFALDNDGNRTSNRHVVA